MDLSYYGLLVCLIIVPCLRRSEAAITLSQTIQPGSGRVMVGADFVVVCSTNADIRNKSLIWYRIQDSLRYQIGVDETINKDFVTDENGQRYGLSGTQADNSTVRIYTLKVRAARFEDTADIECMLSPGSDQSAVTSVAVCAETESSECYCMQSSHWASPKCYQSVEDGSAGIATDTSQYKQATIGLGVSVAVLLLYSLCMCTLLRRDTQAEKELRHRERAERETMIQTHIQAGGAGKRTSATRDGSSNNSDTNSDKIIADIIIKRNVGPGNTRVNGRQAERVMNQSGFSNEAYVPDLNTSNNLAQQQQQQQHYNITSLQAGAGALGGFNDLGGGASGETTYLGGAVSPSKPKSKKKKKVEINVGQSSSNLSDKVQNMGSTEMLERGQSSAGHEASSRGVSSENLTNSDNRTSSYTSTSGGSGGSGASQPPTYEQSMHDTMI